MRWPIALLAITAASVLTSLSAVGPIVVRLAEKLPVLLAVLLAAVFVRLARGMPTIPYEKVAASRARTATQAFRALITAYVHTFWIFVLAILLNLIASMLKPEEVSLLPSWLLPFALTLINGLVVASIIFLILSDVALARTQADMMDEVTSSGDQAEASKSAENVRRAFKEKGLPRARTTDDS